MARPWTGWSNYAAALALTAMLSACGGADTGPALPDEPGDFFGAVAGDDPHAVLAARRVLARGGAAADAAAAYFFMAAVSSPATVSLAAGGACMNYDAASNRTGLLDFRNAASVPGAVRGMAALHAGSGALAWQELVTPAERAARFGIPVPRALARALAEAGTALLQDEGSVFGGEDGRGLAEGEALVQPDLAAMLSAIRTRGGGDFYHGRAARRLVAGASRTGIAIAAEALRAYAPAWRETRRRSLSQGIFGAEAIVHAPGEDFQAGTAFIAAFDRLRSGATSSPSSPSPAAGAASAVVAADALGNAAACLFTLGAPFGAGRQAPGTGIVLAAADAGDDDALLPVIAVNEATREVSFAGTASGGGGEALAGVLALLAEGDGTLDEAFRLPRLLPAEAPARLAAIFCPDGLRNGAASCRAASDPRGPGFATVR